ncbi:MAG: O-antigen ligase family protein [Bacteroidota bacterium]
MKVTALLITVFGVLSLFIGIAEYKKIEYRFLKELILCMLPFLLILGWTVCWDRSPEAYSYSQKSMSLFVFPLAFFMLPVQYSFKQKNILHGLFIFSTLTKALYGFIGVIRDLTPHIGPAAYWKTSTEMFNDLSFAFHVRTFFEARTHVHPTYMNIFLGVAFLLTLDYFLKNYLLLSGRKKVLFSLTLFLILIFQVILAARTPFVATLIAAFVLFFMREKKKIYVLWAGVAVVALTAILIMIVPSFSARLKEISVKNMILPTAENNDSFNIRTGIYKCGLDLVKDNWLYGVGPGNVQKQLNGCYGSFSKEVYDGKNYNTHNQFLDYWAGMGILAPLSLLLLLFYVSYTNFKTGNFLPAGLCVLFFVAMQTENVLTRQNGIVVFSFFLSLYCFCHSNKTGIEFLPINKK